MYAQQRLSSARALFFKPHSRFDVYTRVCTHTAISKVGEYARTFVDVWRLEQKAAVGIHVHMYVYESRG